MNRAQRRRHIKQMTPQNVESVIARVVREREKDYKEYYEKLNALNIENFAIMVAYTLHLEGLGPKRLPRVMKRIIDNIDSFNSGHLSPDDMPAIIEEVAKAGFVFERRNR